MKTFLIMRRTHEVFAFWTGTGFAEKPDGAKRFSASEGAESVRRAAVLAMEHKGAHSTFYVIHGFGTDAEWTTAMFHSRPRLARLSAFTQ